MTRLWPQRPAHETKLRRLLPETELAKLLGLLRAAVTYRRPLAGEMTVRNGSTGSRILNFNAGAIGRPAIQRGIAHGYE